MIKYDRVLNVHIRGKLFVIHSALEDLLKLHRGTLPIGIIDVLDRADKELRAAYIKMIDAEDI